VKQHLHLPGGHVGAVVSKHAAKTLWPQLEAFYAAHDAAPVKLQPVPEVVIPAVSEIAPVVAQVVQLKPEQKQAKPQPPKPPQKTAQKSADVKRLPIKKAPTKQSPRVAR
jgi:hypothetical protein